MNNDPRSHGLWERSAPPAPPTTSLKDEISADVVIIGGGFTGLSAALHIAEGGSSVVVLEGVDVGFGGSGRNSGLVNAGMWVMPDELPNELGEVYGDRLLKLLGNAPSVVFDVVAKHGLACEVVPNGTLHCAVGQKGLDEIKERERQWKARGAPVSVLSAEETAYKVGTTAYAGALLDMRAGTIQPLAYARGLASAAIKTGAKIYTSSPVVAVQEDDKGWIVRTPGGMVRAKWVVVATNAYTNDIWPQVRGELVHLPYFHVSTKPLSDNLRKAILPERQGAWDTKEILCSYRFDQQGRLIFGSVGALRGPGSSIHPNYARRALKKLFPQLGDVELETEWYGRIGMTDNNLPKFHKYGRNIVGFSGYNGRGIAPGTVFGRTLAQLVLGQISEADLPLPVTEFETAKFKPFYEAYYEVGAQIAHAAGARF